MNIRLLQWQGVLGAAAFLLLSVGVGSAHAQQEWQKAEKSRGWSAGEGIPVTLDEVLQAARTGSLQVGIARARAEAASQGHRAASAGLWPSIGAEAGVMQTTDPVGAFGTRLRQARFTEADFDPARLNDPDPLDDWSAGLVFGWTPLDFSRAAAIRAARADVESADLSAEWTACYAEFQAEVRYLEAVGAELLLGTAASAVAAARANLGVIERRHAEGLLTMADVLQAEAALASARARELSADQSVSDARGRLALVMGWESGTPVPADDDWDTEATRSCSAVPRADLSASEAAVRSARARADEAEAARLPKFSGFARLDRHASDVWTDGANNWTVGFGVSLPVFTGFEVAAQGRAASALAEAADLEHEHRIREERTRWAEARRAVDVSEQAAEAAAAALEAAAEAARLMRRRLEQGLATTAEVLSAEARAAELAAAAVGARLTNRRAVAQAAFLDDPRLHTDADTGGFDR